MKRYIHIFILPIIFIFFVVSLCDARIIQYCNKDIKGNVCILVFDPSMNEAFSHRLAQLTTDLFSSETGRLEVLTLERLQPQISAEHILTLPKDKRSQIGGIIDIAFEQRETAEGNFMIEVYHYPFLAIAKEHIKSPEYTFKFSSDSALLAINFHKALCDAMKNQTPSVMMQRAENTNAFLSPALTKKYIRITIQGPERPADDYAGAIATALYTAFKAYVVDEGAYIMGMVTGKSLRHARLEDIEIQIKKQGYADEKTEQSPSGDAVQTSDKLTVKPFPSGLFYVAGLKNLTSYKITYIDTSKKETDYWYELDQGSCVTSSMQGIVRTVPGIYKDYTPLVSKCPETAPEMPETEILDYVIEGATILDGTKNAKRFVGDVGIVGERIIAVGSLRDKKREETINGSGLFLTPGFIDIHSHADWNILDVPYAPSHIRQGITTVLGGNCASSALSIGSYLLEIDKKGAAVNLAMLIGNRPLREKTIGDKKGMLTYDEVYQQKELMDLAMEEGAFGMSSGLIYSISEEAFAWELAEVSKQMKPYGGFYASHVRGESDEALDAIREAIYIGEIAEVPVQISHMKVINRRNWGDMKEYLEIMKNARVRGLDVTGDQYPWRASGPAAHYTLHKLLVREAIKNETPEVVLLKDMPGKYEKYSGKLLTELLEQENMTPEELIADLDLTEDSKIYATYYCLGEEDVILPMKEDFVMVCTDASLGSLEGLAQGKYWNDHPRRFRTYPEFFARYVRDKNVCSWELGVYKCTGLPAERLKLKDRGVIKEGAYADVVLLEPVELDPGADFRDQAPPPRGIKWVFINGQVALRDGEMTKIRNGKALRAYGNCKP